MLAAPDMEELSSILEPGSLLTSEADIAAYSYDAALDRGRPEAVVLAATGRDVQGAVAFCARRKTPFTARGAGTNLSGGCIPLRGGLILALSRLNKILEIDTARGMAVVEPGVVNLNLQKELEKIGHFYAPDPASFKVSTLGGNIAENAGGPRCLKYGVTTNHVLALEVVMPDGSLEKFSLEDRGPEMLSLLVGAEGTLGVVTKAWVKILPLPQTIRTFLAGFGSLGASVECVSAIIAAGVVPRVLEAMDKTTVDSVEAYAHAGYPKAEAVLLIELDGRVEDLRGDAELVERLCRSHGASDFRAAEDPIEREKLWEGRRGAYAAMARLAPNVLVEDGVVPRDRLPEIVRRIQEITSRRGLRAGLLFHAGDGNIHPNIAYDERNAEETARVKEAGREILQACVELGGSLSGEHGIGIDKREAMAWLFSPETLALFRRIKNAWDPDNLANPDKLFPLSGSAAMPGFKRSSARPLSPGARALSDRVRAWSREGRKMAVCGSLSKMSAPPEGLERASTAGLERVEIDLKNYVAAAEAGISPRALRSALAQRGAYCRFPAAEGSLGGLLAARPFPGLRDDILGMRLLLSDGSVAELGGKVVKNVAGYDVARLLLGSCGTLGIILDVTFKIYSRHQEVLPMGKIELSPMPITARFLALKKAFDPADLWVTASDVG
ncbi:MAG: FAD-binding protein [Elusimicrobia bacterium]|nr:FAD-binding protein [Elusimicrobiota bacterium]